MATDHRSASLDQSGWGVSPGAQRIADEQLRRALPALTIITGIVSLASDIAQDVLARRLPLQPSYVVYVAMVALGIQWVRRPPARPGPLGAGVSIATSTMLGVYLLQFPKTAPLVHFGILGFGAFYFLVHRRDLALSQLALITWFGICLFSLRQRPDALSLGVVCGVLWCGGLAVHVGRVRVLNQLDETTRALHEESQARRMAEEQALLAQKHESLGTMSAGVAHDFNNLLVGIVGGLDLLEEARPAPDAFEGELQNVRSACRAAQELCRRLLEIAGGQPLVLEVLDVNDPVRDGLKLARLGLTEACELIEDLSATPIHVTAEPTQLRQVVLNLVTNATEALPSEGGTIRVSTTRTTGSTDDARAVIAIEDDGPGVADDIRTRIFDPFFSTRFTGRGLGLAAAATTARALGGEIELVGSGPGARFEIRLPVVQQPPIEKTPARTTKRPAELSGTALVVDDDPTVRRTASMLLERIGFEVVCAEDGAAALALFKTGPEAFRVALVDATMPTLDGPTTLRRLREIAPEIPALLISGFSTGTERDRLDTPDGVGFLAKPFSRRDLELAVRDVLG